MPSPPLSPSHSRAQEDAPSPPAGRTVLSPLEVEVIDFFVRAVKVIGIPKSVGEIYGLLFVAPEPLSLDELVVRLKISKGSASQGLSFLKNLGAIRAVYVAGSRRDHFCAETELKRLASGFIKGELEPHVESGEVRLDRLTDLAGALADTLDGDFYRERIGKLRSWHQQARRVLPWVQKFLS